MISRTRLAALIKLYNIQLLRRTESHAAHFFFWRWIPYTAALSYGVGARSAPRRDGINSALIAGSCRKSHIWKAYPRPPRKFLQGGVKKSSIVCPSIILTFVLPPFLLLPLLVNRLIKSVLLQQHMVFLILLWHRGVSYQEAGTNSALIQSLIKFLQEIDPLIKRLKLNGAISRPILGSTQDFIIVDMQSVKQWDNLCRHSLPHRTLFIYFIIWKRDKN